VLVIVEVVFVIVLGLCLLLWGDCICYCVEVVFVIVWGLCLLLCWGCVCYCHFCLVVQINKVVWDKFVEVSGWSCARHLCQFEIGALDKGLLDLSVSHFVCPTFWCVGIVFEVH